MKRPPILKIEVRFVGSMANKAKAVEALKQPGFVDASDSVTWRELFPEYGDEELPGVCLAGSLLNKDMTQKEFSEMTGIPQRHISEMENGKGFIGKMRAKILVKALKVGYRILL